MDQVKLPILVTYIQKNKQLIDFRREKITFIYILKKKKESLSHKTIFAEQMWEIKKQIQLLLLKKVFIH